MWNQPYLSRGLNLNRRSNSLNSSTEHLRIFLVQRNPSICYFVILLRTLIDIKVSSFVGNPVLNKIKWPLLLLQLQATLHFQGSMYNSQQYPLSISLYGQ